MIYFLSNIYRRTLLDAALWRKQQTIKEMKKKKDEPLKWASNNTNPLQVRTEDYWF